MGTVRQVDHEDYDRLLLEISLDPRSYFQILMHLRMLAVVVSREKQKQAMQKQQVVTPRELCKSLPTQFNAFSSVSFNSLSLQIVLPCE